MSKHHHKHRERCPKGREDFIERLIDSCCYLRPSEELRPTEVLPITERKPQQALGCGCDCGRKSCHSFVCPEEEAIFEKIIKHCCRCNDEKKCDINLQK